MEAQHKYTLILNADFSPIGICKYQKAFLLLFLDKADLMAEGRDSIRTVSEAYPMPSVIKLKNYVNIPYTGVVLTRENIFRRDGFSCQYCGENKDLTLDHLIPKSKGGKSSWKNLVTACKKCNAVKGHSSPEESGLKLRQQPFKPNHILFIRDFSGKMNEQWLPFLGAKRSVSA